MTQVSPLENQFCYLPNLYVIISCVDLPGWSPNLRRREVNDEHDRQQQKAERAEFTHGEEVFDCIGQREQNRQEHQRDYDSKHQVGDGVHAEVHSAQRDE